MKRRQFLQTGTALASPWVIGRNPAQAQAPAYPDRPITILQGFAAGGEGGKANDGGEECGGFHPVMWGSMRAMVSRRAR